MGLLKLRVYMLGTLALIIGVSTLFFTIVLTLAGGDILLMPLFVVAFSLVQWLIAPYMIDAIYRVRQVSPREEPELHRMVERLSMASGIAKPQVMLSALPIPNAFAYGSPLTGSRVAVTQGLLEKLEGEEVEAVIGHELGHLKHRDVQIMMFVSVLPALFYYIGYSFMMSSYYYQGRSRQGDGGLPVLIGGLSMVLYFVMTLFTLGLSRLREYYADSHAAQVVGDGPRKLSEALAKITYSTGQMQRRKLSGSGSFRTLFISDPERAPQDAAELSHAGGYMADQDLVRRVTARQLTWADRFMELFSTHPNIVKRIRALQEY
ncbi:MAG: zinc metalloprotease HtpX [Candidatus Bathyarchaeia archaeon]